MDKNDRIKNCLIRAGLKIFPEDLGEDLSKYGFDSLITVLVVIEMQKEFGIKISTKNIRPESFANLKSLAELVPSIETESEMNCKNGNGSGSRSGTENENTSTLESK